MEEKKQNAVETTNKAEETKDQALSETWAQDALQDLNDFIESQGIYIRQ